MKRYDVVIAGGGPAGSTVASLVKKYAPQLRVLVLEKAHFPRHHIGESMLAGATPVLREMGAYDKVNGYGFIEKLGATYVWGARREPWGFAFDQIIEHLARQGRTLGSDYVKAWQVRRGEYDQLLLNHAAEMGAEVREGAQVLQPRQDGASGRVVGVTYRDDRGLHEVESALFIDCTGQDALLGHRFKLRQYDEQMNNYALYGYWQNGKWQQEYIGTPEHSRIFIATSPRGWIWYIPLHRDVISVGFVTHRQTLKQMPAGPATLYHEEIAACPEIAALLDAAHLVRIAPDQPHDVMAIQDWSYTSRQMAGPGWALCGDAAGFVDPILSSGGMLAHELGQKAAYTVNAMFKANSDAQIDDYWRFYQETYRTNLTAYRDMARFWYSNNFSMESWWWEAQRTVSGGQADGSALTGREAFMRVASGYANRTESLSLFGSYPLHEAVKLVEGLFGGAPTPQEQQAVARRYQVRRPRLHSRARVGNGLYYYQGLVRNTRRVTAPDGQRHLDLHPGEEVLVQMLDGKHTLAELDAAAAKIRAMQQRLPVRTGAELVVQLEGIGALG
jgi:flavin-dependent dehydrogenase